MRVSTSQFYAQNSLQISNKQSDLNEEVNYISSGKRVLTAKDDPVSYGELAGYKNDLASIEKYQRNIIQAENHNSLVDTTLGNAENIMNELRDLMLQANSGVRSDDDLASIAQQANHSLQQILDIANTQDESGSYVFSGYQTENSPFVLQTDNSVNYRGDNGTREIQIAKNVMISTSQSGEEVFQNVPNAIGDFSAIYNENKSGIEVESAAITDRANHNSLSPAPDYTFNFTTATDLTITDNSGGVITTVSGYVPGQTISFNGIDIKLSGNPLPDDSFTLTPDKDISVFETIKSAIDWINNKGGDGEDPQVQVDFNTTLEQLNDAMNHLTSRRAQSGINLQVIDRQKSNHLDTELYLESGRSSIEDLDFVKAISTFEQSQIALQAAQQTFTQVQGLSLLNYI